MRPWTFPSGTLWMGNAVVAHLRSRRRVGPVAARHGKVIPLHHRWLLPRAREPVFITTPIPPFGPTAAGHTCPRPRGLAACPACKMLTAGPTYSGCPCAGGTGPHTLGLSLASCRHLTGRCHLDARPFVGKVRLELFDGLVSLGLAGEEGGGGPTVWDWHVRRTRMAPSVSEGMRIRPYVYWS